MKSIWLLFLVTGILPGKETVYVCRNSSSITYHAKKECRSIKPCRQDVLEVSLEEATDQYKKKACRVCYKKPDFQIFPSPVIVPLDGIAW